MKENEFGRVETKTEHVPTLEEVHSVLKELVEKAYQEVRRCEDEQGLYLLEIVVPGDLDGESIEYSYMRKGQHKEGKSVDSEIHVTYYRNGVPVSGGSVAKVNILPTKMRYVNGSWRLI